MANPSTRYGFRPYKNQYHIEYASVCASNVIAKGDPVTLETSGDIAVATATSAALYGAAANACTTTAANERTLIPVFVAGEEDLYIGQCSGSATYALKGDLVDIEGTTGAFQINEDASSYKVLQLIRPYTDQGDAEGTNCEYVFRIKASQYSGTEVS